MKLHANGLRIGNYTFKRLKSGYGRKNECKLNLHDLLRIQEDRLFIYEPIPLTEEWLLKFGKIEWISKDIDGIFYWFNGEKKYLKFVHLLQNTYFYIEQKELLCVNI